MGIWGTFIIIYQLYKVVSMYLVAFRFIDHASRPLSCVAGHCMCGLLVSKMYRAYALHNSETKYPIVNMLSYNAGMISSLFSCMFWLVSCYYFMYEMV